MRTIFFLFLFIFLPISLPAQASFGLKGGLNMARAKSVAFGGFDTGEIIPTGAWSPSLHAGLWARVPVTKKFSIQPELLYTHKGWSILSSGGIHDTSGEINLYYLTLPLITQYQYRSLSIGFGPELSFLLDHDDQFLSIENNQIEVGITVDIALEFVDRWTVNIRYSEDLSPFISYTKLGLSGVPVPEKSHYKNRTIQLALSYTLLSWEN